MGHIGSTNSVVVMAAVEDPMEVLIGGKTPKLGTDHRWRIKSIAA